MLSAPEIDWNAEERAQGILNEWCQLYFSGAKTLAMGGVPFTLPLCKVVFGQDALGPPDDGKPMLHWVCLNATATGSDRLKGQLSYMLQVRISAQSGAPINQVQCTAVAAAVRALLTSAGPRADLAEKGLYNVRVERITPVSAPGELRRVMTIHFQTLVDLRTLEVAG